ncbi:MAG: DUF2029 domain-containing protein [Anaerolineales bacterium]|nr:DUF2029 domain-containing protein [Anaerolineales bacterium]
MNSFPDAGKIGRTAGLALGLALLFGLAVVGVHAAFTSQVAGANDFFPRWVGAQLFWQQGIDPYSQTATEAIQRQMYGGELARPDQDQVLFVYPFYTLFLLLPLTWLPLAYAWIQAIWLVTLMACLVGGMLLLLRLVRWPRLPAWLLASLLLWSLLFYNNARTLILGQFAAVVFVCLVASLLALRSGHDLTAGALLALTTIKPQMVFLLIPALLLWAAWQRRWRFVAGFGGAMALLAGASFLLLPGWLGGFIAQLRAYPGYTITPSPLRFLTEYFFPWLGRPVEIGAAVLLVGWMLWGWWRLRRETAVSPTLLLTLGLTLLVGNMVVVRTATTNYLPLYIPLFVALRYAAVRLRHGSAWVAAFVWLSIVALWWLFLATVQGDLEHPIMYLPLPLGLLALLLAWRPKGTQRTQR